MQSVGARLRDAREKKGFTLDEIGARTRINTKNLSAIERDEVKSLSSPFIYRSFVRQYADTVELDFRMIAPGVDTLAGHMRQPDLPGRGDFQPVRIAPVQPRPKRDYKWVAALGLVAGVLLLCSGGYTAWRYYAPRFHNAAVASPSSPVRAAIRMATPAASPSANSSPVSAADEKIHLKLAATEPTWLTVSADGRPAYTGILKPDQTKVLEGQQSAKIRTGNAGGVIINFNGRDLGTIGPHGKTRIVIFTRAGFEVQPDSVPDPPHHIGG